MSKMVIKATPEQQAWIAERGERRWAAITTLDFFDRVTLVSLHKSYKAALAVFNGRAVSATDALSVIKGTDFFDTYDFWVEPPIVEVCEVETQPVAEPAIHPSLDWIANKVLGCNYIDCTPDGQKLVDLAKVNEHGNIDLSWQDLSYLHLSGAILKDADLSNAIIISANLNCAELQGANLFNANIAYTALSNADMSFCNLMQVHLRRNFMSYTRLLGATMADGVVLSGKYHFIHNIGSDNGILELYKCDSGWYIKRGCFSGSLPEFLAAVEKKHGDNEHGKRYRAIVAALCD